MTLEDIENSGYTLHHTSFAPGYIPRGTPEKITPYKGRFGTGYKVEFPCEITTAYHYVSYFIKEVTECKTL